MSRAARPHAARRARHASDGVGTLAAVAVLGMLACVPAAAQSPDAAGASFVWGASGAGSELDTRTRSPGLRLGAATLSGTLLSRELSSAGRPLRVADLVGEGRLELGDRRGAWLELAHGHHAGLAPVVTSPVVGGGVWVPIGALTFTSAIRHWTARVPQAPVWIYTWPPSIQGLPGPWPDTWTQWSNVLPFWMPMPPRTVHATAVTSALRWSRDALELELRSGVISGAGMPRVQLNAAGATFWCLPGLALTLVGGPPVHARTAGDFVGYPEFAMGLRFEPGHPAHRSAGRAGMDRDAWRLRPAGGGGSTLELWSPGAESLELRGDVTGWSTVALRRGPGGWWRLPVAIPPGVHQLQICTDGGPWGAPPGLPIEPASFGGRAGVLVVE